MADEKHVAGNHFDDEDDVRDDEDETEKGEVGLEDEEKRLAELKVVFSSFDTNNNGKIIKSELDAILNAMGQSANDSLLKDIINEVDNDGNGYITFDNFVSMMTDKNIEEITDASEVNELHHQKKIVEIQNFPRSLPPLLLCPGYHHHRHTYFRQRLKVLLKCSQSAVPDGTFLLTD
mmetsp:Transcript_34267/g.55094  ORF Transcript_34267/g.55094 Transcript_34267/m.55094 type:complete len:177 (+) Transcript_34267:46-576(+)